MSTAAGRAVPRSGVTAVVLRPMTRADLPLLARWLAEPLVARWWAHETTPEAVERDFAAALDGREPTELLLACLDGVPYGLVQRYRVEAYQEYVDELAPVVEVPPGALSIDYLIGEPDRRGCGLGAAMVVAAVETGWVAHPAARHVLVPVAAGNAASWRALERAGFRRVAEGELEPDNPLDPRDHYVYRCERPAQA